MQQLLCLKLGQDHVCVEAPTLGKSELNRSACRCETSETERHEEAPRRLLSKKRAGEKAEQKYFKGTDRQRVQQD